MNNKKLKLTKRQKELLTGKLLGDGHLETRNDGRTYRLKIEHSIKQKEYVDWFYQEFRDWVNTPPKARMHKSGWQDKEYEKYYFQTLSTASLRFYGSQFYGSEGKKVPKLIHRWLTPLALAVWYMDDGSIKSNAHRTVLLNTHGFSPSGLKRLQSALKTRYGIETRLRNQKDGTQIYIPSESVDTFLSTIKPFIIPSMYYKIPKVWLTQLPKK